MEQWLLVLLILLVVLPIVFGLLLCGIRLCSSSRSKGSQMKPRRIARNGGNMDTSIWMTGVGGGDSGLGNTIGDYDNGGGCDNPDWGDGGCDNGWSGGNDGGGWSGGGCDDGGGGFDSGGGCD